MIKLFQNDIFDMATMQNMFCLKIYDEKGVLPYFRNILGGEGL